MASHAPNFGRASALPLSTVLSAIPSYPRPVVERLVTRLIDYLDGQDGDTDFEETDAEDELISFHARCRAVGAGCPCSDSGVDDEDCGIEDMPHDAEDYQ